MNDSEFEEMVRSAVQEDVDLSWLRTDKHLTRPARCGAPRGAEAPSGLDDDQSCSGVPSLSGSPLHGFETPDENEFDGPDHVNQLDLTTPEHAQAAVDAPSSDGGHGSSPPPLKRTIPTRAYLKSSCVWPHARVPPLSPPPGTLVEHLGTRGTRAARPSITRTCEHASTHTHARTHARTRAHPRARPHGTRTAT